LSTKILPPGPRAGTRHRHGPVPPAGIPSPPHPARPHPATVLHKVATVARRLACSVRQVRRLIASGALPVHRLGRAVRVSEDDLVRFLAARRRA
jgi:excisionase family DNA binding protein